QEANGSRSFHMSTALARVNKGNDQTPLVSVTEGQPIDSGRRLRGSESYRKLMQSNALSNKVEMCEAYVTIGTSENSLSKGLCNLQEQVLAAWKLSNASN